MAALWLVMACAGKGESGPTEPDAAAGRQETAEIEEEEPSGHGSCCADNLCTFGEYPGRKEWTEACALEGKRPGQWCPGQCMLDRDTLPPSCQCL